MLMRADAGSSLPPGTVLLGTTGLLIFSNSPTDYLVVPGCLVLALLAVRTLPDLIPMRTPLALALAGATEFYLYTDDIFIQSVARYYQDIEKLGIEKALNGVLQS